jgi:hypothetical protein
MTATGQQESARRMYWRAGRREDDRAIYAQLGPEPGDQDWLIGIMDSMHLAQDVCAAHNQVLTPAFRILPGSMPTLEDGTPDFSPHR